MKKNLILVCVLLLAMAFPILSQAASAVVAWDAPTGTITGYNIYRSTTSGVFTAKLNAAPITALTYTDTTVVAGTTYFYVVRAVNGTGESPNSNQITVVVPVALPAAPTNLRLISVTP